jgi:hypothetical protein
MFPIDFTSLLSGDENRYPFDKYSAEIDLLITAPGRAKAKLVAPESLEDNTNPLATDLVVGASDLDKSEPVAIREDFTASLPGVKFKGVITQDDTNKLMHTSIEMRRANNVISVSILVMMIMLGVAISIMAMVLQTAASPGEISLIPLSLCVTLIFGLPALRSVQPRVPGVGVLGDYISFIWAEFIVSISAIALSWIWIIRSKQRTNK